MAEGRDRQRTFLHRHSLTIVSGAVLACWVLLYSLSSPETHLGAFFGNAIADWSGVVVIVFGTKFMYEKGSAESRQPPHTFLGMTLDFLRDHSLSIFFLLTGVGWVVLYAVMDPGGKWGQVVGNIVSEWTQVLGLVLLTKKLTEIHSKEASH